MATSKRKIKGGEVGSVKKLRTDLKKGGGKGFMTRVPDEGSLVVRFMTEPDGWVQFYEHYDAVRKYYPCSDDCPGCDEGDNPSQRYLANAIDVDENKVIPLLMPKPLASSILKRYDKYKTLLDRDYELTRTGSGYDTEYDSIPESPNKMNVSRYDELDLWPIIEAQLPSDDEDEDDDDEDETPRRSRGGKGGKRSKPSRNTIEDDDDMDDDDDEDDMPPRRRKPSSASSKKPLKRKPASSGAKRKMKR